MELEKLMKTGIKNYYEKLQNKSQCKQAEVNQRHKKMHIFSCTTMIAKHLTLTFAVK